MVALTEYQVRETPMAEWDQVVRTFPHYTVFHTSAWLKTIVDVHGVQPLLLQVMDGERSVAAWPCLTMRKGPFLVVGSPLPGWSTAYMGPLFAPQAQPAAVMGAMLQHPAIRRHSYLACKIIELGAMCDMRQYGFSHVMDLETYVADLKLDCDTLWGNLKSECRSRIRKAQKSGLIIEEEPDGGFLDEFWKMSVETFEKSHMLPTYSRAFLDAVWTNLRSANAVRALSAMLDGSRVATLVIVMDHRRMYYWAGGAYNRFRNLPSHNLLHWHVIEQGRSAGMKEYDFISTLGGPGRFKSTFGPNRVLMGRQWEHSRSRLVATLKRHYQSFLLRRRRVKA